MRSLKRYILEAIDKGIEQALLFDLNDYDSNDLYISKKKISFDAQEEYERAKYCIKNYAEQIINGKRLSKEEKSDFLKALKIGFTYDVGSDEDTLISLIEKYCKQFGNTTSLNWIDVSNITSMSCLFANSKFNGDISKWNTSNVQYMDGMFDCAESFNLDISNWDVSNVEDMACMFYNANKFNLPIGKWDVSNVTNMSNMFAEASRFNQPIGDWDVSNVRNMRDMFDGAFSFNQDLFKWDVSNVKDMSGMFYSAKHFSKDISIWNVKNVANIGYMFDYSNMEERFKPHFDTI